MTITNSKSYYKQQADFERVTKMSDMNYYSDLQGDAQRRNPVENIKMWSMSLLDEKKIEEHQFTEI